MYLVLRCRFSVYKRCETPDTGGNLQQELEALPVEFWCEDADPGDVAARTGERRHEACPNHVVGKCRNRDRACRTLQRPTCLVSTTVNRIGLRSHQCKRRLFKRLGGY